MCKLYQSREESSNEIALFVGGLVEASISHSNWIPLVGRKLLIQALQSPAFFVILRIFGLKSDIEWWKYFEHNSQLTFSSTRADRGGGYPFEAMQR